jgi:hypothetical protein
MTGASEAIQAPSDSDTRTPLEEDVIDVTWKLSYSGQTPRQLVAGAEVMPGITVYDFATTSERGQIIGQERSEVISKLNRVKPQSHRVCI